MNLTAPISMISSLSGESPVVSRSSAIHVSSSGETPCSNSVRAGAAADSLDIVDSDAEMLSVRGKSGGYSGRDCTRTGRCHDTSTGTLWYPVALLGTLPRTTDVWMSPRPSVALTITSKGPVDIGVHFVVQSTQVNWDRGSLMSAGCHVSPPSVLTSTCCTPWECSQRSRRLHGMRGARSTPADVRAPENPRGARRATARC